MHVVNLETGRRFESQTNFVRTFRASPVKRHDSADNNCNLPKAQLQRPRNHDGRKDNRTTLRTHRIFVRILRGAFELLID